LAGLAREQGEHCTKFKGGGRIMTWAGSSGGPNKKKKDQREGKENGLAGVTCEETSRKEPKCDLVT